MGSCVDVVFILDPHGPPQFFKLHGPMGVRTPTTPTGSPALNTDIILFYFYLSHLFSRLGGGANSPLYGFGEGHGPKCPLDPPLEIHREHLLFDYLFKNMAVTPKELLRGACECEVMRGTATESHCHTQHAWRCGQAGLPLPDFLCLKGCGMWSRRISK